MTVTEDEYETDICTMIYDRRSVAEQFVETDEIESLVPSYAEKSYGIFPDNENYSDRVVTSARECSLAHGT